MKETEETKASSQQFHAVRRSLERVQGWVEDHQYKGYDPGDGLTSFLRPLTFGNLFAERLLLQFVWKSPINVRPLIGVVPLESTKGRGFMASGYLHLHKAFSDTVYLEKATACLDWLDRNKEPRQPGHCWGNHFDFSTRSGRMVAHTPTIVWSGLIGQAFLEAFDQTGDTRYLRTAESICQWILTLPREVTPSGDCLSYTAVARNSVHNSNLLGAALLARTWRHSPDEKYREVARKAVEYSCSRQRPDGSWWYGEEEKYHWIDNFHTGYNLDSLKRYIDSTGDEAFQPNLERGYRYFRESFFEDSGCPRYYHDRTYPIDIQCAAQAIDTFCLFAEEEVEALAMAEKIANWTIENLQAPSGYFYYRKLPVLTVKTPYLHWGQATMFKALSHLLLKSRDCATNGKLRPRISEVTAAR